MSSPGGRLLDGHAMALLEAALWEIADETAHAPAHTALDGTIDAVRANVMSGMMPEEAQLLFAVSDGGLSNQTSTPPPLATAAPPVPADSPSSVLHTPDEEVDTTLVRIMDELEVHAEPQAAVVDSDGEEWEEWPEGAAPASAPAVPTAADLAAERAASRLAQERARMQKNGNLRNRAAEKVAEAAAESVLANLPSRPT